MMATANDLGVLIELDHHIDMADRTAEQARIESLRLRWEFGHAMLAMRVGKRLPNGALVALAKATGKSQTELKYRMQFAERYDQDELAHVWASSSTWREISRGLKPGPKPQPSKPIEHPITTPITTPLRGDDEDPRGHLSVVEEPPVPRSAQPDPDPEPPQDDSPVLVVDMSVRRLQSAVNGCLEAVDSIGHVSDPATLYDVVNAIEHVRDQVLGIIRRSA